MTPARILVAAGDTHDAARLCGRLGREGFVAEAASTPAALDRRLDAQTFSLVVLDLALPGVDLPSFARRLQGDAATPLITLGPPGGVLDRVLSLEFGADDSLSTPLHPQELAARIRAVLRRAGGIARRPAAGAVRFDGWTLRRHPRRLTSPDGRPAELSDTEFALLVAFVDAPGRTMDRATLRVAVGRDGTGGRGIDLLVSRLRRKLGAAGASPALLRTVRGAGYAFEPVSLSG